MASPILAAETRASGPAEAYASGGATSRRDELLCLETPDVKVVVGIRWLQTIRGCRRNRFNHCRKASGPVFRGGYKANTLNGDGDAVGRSATRFISIRTGRACSRRWLRWDAVKTKMPLWVIRRILWFWP